MALDPTARLSNAKDSVKKYFVDNLERGQGIPISFDTTLSTPKVQGTEVEKWVVLDFGPSIPGSLFSQDLRIFCCSKKDAEGFKLAQVRDSVVGLLIDDTRSDSMGRIPLYRSYANQEWTLIGGMVVTSIREGGDIEAEDKTKFRIINCRLRWGAKS